MLEKEFIEVIRNEKFDSSLFFSMMSEGLGTVAESLNVLKENMSSESPNLFKNMLYDKVEEYIIYSQEIDGYLVKVKSIIDMLPKDQSDVSVTQFSSEKPVALDSNNSKAIVTSELLNKDVAIKQTNIADCITTLYVMNDNFNVCCKNELEDKYAGVIIFEDLKTGVVNTSINIWTKHCTVCDSHYILQHNAQKLLREYGEEKISIIGTHPEPVSNPVKMKVVHVRIIGKDVKCPSCGSGMTCTLTQYVLFKDSNKDAAERTCKMYTKTCFHCNIIFVLKGALETICKQVGLDRTNIKIDDAENNDTPHCMFMQCEEKEIFRDNLCRYHYNQEHYLSK